ncbi:MAG TPA: hypothetical protein DIU07_18685, partial [Rhodobacteraceae bacterium]|nr:hypothetical protein [Paracoccaceae bacterium]
PPAEPVAAVAPAAEPALTDASPLPAVPLDPEAPPAALDPAAMAAAALAADPTPDPAAEPPAAPAGPVAPAPQAAVAATAEPAAGPTPDPAPETATLEADAAPVAADVAAVTPLAAAEPDIAPVVDLPSNLRPLPRPLRTLDPVPLPDLAAIAPAPEPAALPVEDPTPVQSATVAPPEDLAKTASDGADIVAAPLPEPEPEPEPVVPTLPDEPQGVLYVSSSGVAVRAGPSADDRAIDEMPRGSAVVDLGGKGDGWRMILLPNGAAGYISDAQLSLAPGQ